nr:hypothetical protein [Aeromicrobium sp.]
MLKVFADVGFTVVPQRLGQAVALRMSTRLDDAALDAVEIRAALARARRSARAASVSSGTAASGSVTTGVLPDG